MNNKIINLTDKEYLENIKLLNVWAYAYYVEDKFIATDDEYDKLYHQILKYEKGNFKKIAFNSPTKRIGGVLKDGFKKAEHKKQMWSMEDIFSLEDAMKWENRVQKKLGEVKNFFCEPKFDGASLNLQYKNGLLVKAISRGDGKVGEDITNNAKTMHSIPLTIDYQDEIEIRGEVVVLKKDFDYLNRERKKEGKIEFSNLRNLASGSLRKLNSLETAKRKLVFYPWGLGENSLTHKFLSEKMNFIYNLGFLSPPYSQKCKNLEDIQKFYNKLISKRDKIEMLIDGMVIRIDNIEKQEQLGYTAKFPRWMIAYKFPAIEQVTKINSVSFQVGRTGIITPVANVEPINIDGALISRVTLYNFHKIREMDLQINDEVVLIRSGDVIPKISKVFKDRRDRLKSIKINQPILCPSCSQKILYLEKQAICNNSNCQEKIIHSILYWTKKENMNISGLGYKNIKILVENRKIKNILDLYSLKIEDIINLDTFQDKKSQNVINSIQSSINNRSLENIISSLGINHIGISASKIIAKKFGINFIDLKMEDLITLDGFGEKMAESLYKYISENKKFILNLLEIVKFIEVKANYKNNKFKDKTIVLTGTMSKSREEIQKYLENLGANISKSITKKTDFLICGDKSGSKLEKAKILNIEILTEKDI